jgi:hypothetical protein
MARAENPHFQGPQLSRRELMRKTALGTGAIALGSGGVIVDSLAALGKETAHTERSVRPGQIFDHGNRNLPLMHVIITELSSADDFRYALDIARDFPGNNFTFAPRGEVLVGTNGRRHRRLLETAADEGHDVANYTMHGIDMRNKPFDRNVSEVYQAHKAIEAVLGDRYKDHDLVAPRQLGVFPTQPYPNVLEVARFLKLALPTWNQHGSSNPRYMEPGDIIRVDTDDTGEGVDDLRALPKILEKMAEKGIGIAPIRAIPHQDTGFNPRH